MVESVAAIVIDNGSGYMKAGLSTEKTPKVIIPSVVGYPKTDGAWEVYCGEGTQNKTSTLNLKYPIVHEAITDWDSIQHLWRYTFEKLNVDVDVLSNNNPVLLLVSPYTSQADRETMVSKMFGTMFTKKIYVCESQVMSLSAAGKKTGLVLDIGENSCCAVPISDGKVISNAMMKLDVGGRNLTEYLTKLLTARGFSFTTDTEKEHVKIIKETYCYVASNFEDEMGEAASSPTLEKVYVLPDGLEITIGNEQFRCPEALFQPGFIGLDSKGIHHLVRDAIMKCDSDLQSIMWSNIVLSGGGSRFAGINERLLKELNNLDSAVKIDTILNPDNSDISAWVGGTELSTAETTSGWILRPVDEESQ